jgi:putative transposase
MMAQESIESLEALLQGLFQREEGPKKLLAFLAQEAMEAEMQSRLQAKRHERTGGRRGHRNGYKPRTLNTRAGLLELCVPQSRNCEPYQPSLFARYQRSERALLVACAEMYYQGVSTRDVRQVLGKLGAKEVSSMTVSRIAQELDGQLEAFRGRLLDQKLYRYLLIDARYQKIRVSGQIVSCAVLVAAGVTSEGYREILEWRVADSESEASWSGLFKNLKERGLKGLELIISDAHGGIRAAMARHFQGIPWQRCRVHFKRELHQQVPFKVGCELMREVSWVYQPEDKPECLRRAAELADHWRRRCPKVAAMMEAGFEDTLSVCTLNPADRLRLGSTNVLENLMKQLKSRTRVIGIFANEASCHRLIGALLVERHEQWQLCERRYLCRPEEMRSKPTTQPPS